MSARRWETFHEKLAVIGMLESYAKVAREAILHEGTEDTTRYAARAVLLAGICKELEGRYREAAELAGQIALPPPPWP